MSAAHELLVRKLKDHSDLSATDVTMIRALPNTERSLSPGSDIVRQGDRPHASIVVLTGMVARYHTLPAGRRQYLSLHIPGDMPDAQTLFLETMDHAVCAIDKSVVALIPHAALLKAFNERPRVGFAIWRETLIDAAIFREAITNNSARPVETRLAHLFCEQYYRARAGRHAMPGSCRFPLTQTQIGEVVGASLPSVSRALQKLRRTKVVDLYSDQLFVRDWAKMALLGEFNPNYLHLRKPSRL